ncbi:hypothetical protein C8F01DRAFT_1123219 [Mycena amicta]|nr:hypothetical protein C8F01DRAFT_1123219 [Mycena amicta]
MLGGKYLSVLFTVIVRDLRLASAALVASPHPLSAPESTSISAPGCRTWWILDAQSVKYYSSSGPLLTFFGRSCAAPETRRLGCKVVWSDLMYEELDFQVKPFARTCRWYDRAHSRHAPCV